MWKSKLDDTQYELFDEQLILDNDKAKLIPPRIPMQGQYVVIDAINVVCSVESFTTNEMYQLNTNAKYLFRLDLNTEQLDDLNNMVLERMKSELSYIFGDMFGVITPKNAGIHYYKHGYTVYSPENEILLNIGIGGQNETVFFGLTGMGCKLADTDWESRLHDWLDNVAVNGRITRIDLAHDDFDGEYSSFKWADEQESNDRFLLPKTRNRPACTYAGEFKHGDPQNKGLTLYVGSRKNGKVIRCYEKGKQLGDTSSAWFRSELEIHAKKRLIPFDVLLNPTEYFCGAYPYCLDLITLAKKNQGDHTPQIVDKFETIKRESKINLIRAIDILRHQFGKYIKVFGEIFTFKTNNTNRPDYKKIFEKLCTKKHKDYYPKRLKLTANTFKNTSFVDIDELLYKKYNPTPTKRKMTDDEIFEYFYQTTKNQFLQNPAF